MKIVLPRKILIVKPSSLGDIVHSLPVLNTLNRCFPDAEIHWVVARGFEGILEGHPMVKRLWIINKDGWRNIKRTGATISELRRLFKDLKAERFDYVIDLQGLFRSGLITKATGAPVRIGFMEAREGSTVFYTHTVAGGRDIHAVDRYLKIVGFLGCTINSVRFPFPPTSNSLSITLYSLLSGDYAVIAPAARRQANRWPAVRFGEVASLLPVKTVVIGNESDRSLADKVVAASKGMSVSIAGRTDLKGLVEVIKGARFMVCNDSGPMHIAAALGIRVFAIFGPTNPVRTGPYGNNHVIFRRELFCSPCYKKTCKTHKCLDMIDAMEVADTINKFLEGDRDK